ncbi:MAG TPA: hypothetical protein VGK96_28275 [Candidatus Sulfotelmatobacter sp.]|jgi:hypothetical protein
MGSLVSSIFDILSGNPTQSEQNQLSTLGTQESSTGTGAVNAANDFYGDILAGGPAEAEALAPEIKANQDQLQQSRNANAQFGNRSGGLNAATQAGVSQSRGNIIDLEGQLKSSAAAGEAGLGTNLLSQASGNINSEAGLAQANRSRMDNAVGGIASGVASIATGLPIGGASDPYQGLYNAQQIAANPTSGVSEVPSDFAGLLS